MVEATAEAAWAGSLRSVPEGLCGDPESPSSVSIVMLSYARSGKRRLAQI
jgi:hypothetical protein